MDDQLSGPEQTPRPEGWAAHDWYPYQSYLNVHHSFMERLIQDGSVLASRLSFLELPERAPREVNLKGVVACAEGALLHVDKWLTVRRNRRGQLEVKGQDYIYHARLRGHRNLFRYCTAHGLDDLHVHRYDLQSGVELGRPKIALHELPPLNEVILEAIETAKLAHTLAP